MGTWQESSQLGALASDAAEGVLDPALWAARQVAMEAADSTGEQASLVDHEALVRQFLDGQLCVSNRDHSNYCVVSTCT